MNFQLYLSKFQEILEEGYKESPYDNPNFVNYTNLNNSRQNRWLKKGQILPELVQKIKTLAPQKWVLITEPWCGDASHTVPFIQLLAELSENIELEIQLRDKEPFLIEKYLTNGGKSIPILVGKDELNNDLFVWGPRPKECQELMLSNKASGMEMDEQKKALQKWYNQDKGVSIQKELLELLE